VRINHTTDMPSMHIVTFYTRAQLFKYAVSMVDLH